MRPQRRQPTGLPHPWDSPGKNTGVGCHFLLQCIKVKSESEFVQSCPTLRNPMDFSLTSFLHPWDFPGKSTGVGCHCLLWTNSSLVFKCEQRSYPCTFDSIGFFNIHVNIYSVLLKIWVVQLVYYRFPFCFPFCWFLASSSTLPSHPLLCHCLWTNLSTHLLGLR